MLPSKFSPIASGSLVKEIDEHPYDYVRKIRFHCSYMSDVRGQSQWDLPERVAAMIVHCLPDMEPFLAVKQKFSDIYLPGDIPNYARYKSPSGQWSLDGDFFWRYLVRVEKQHFQKLNLPLPTYYHPIVPVPQEVESIISSSSSSSSGGGDVGEEEVSSGSSCQIIPNPNPPPTPPIIDIPSDTEPDDDDDPMEDEPESPVFKEEDDPEFDPRSYKQSSDKYHNVRID